MTSNIRIRPAKKKDLSAILWLYTQPEFDNGVVLSPNLAVKVFQRICHYPDYKIYVALFKKKIIGSFTLLIMDNLGHSGAPSGIVEDVVVDTVYQRKGIGKVMMVYARELCKKKNCYKMVLSSNLKRKGAHAFYGSLGFKRHGVSFMLNI